MNLGKKGISGVTVGRGGWFSANIGKKGIKNNLNVPGTGISYQTKPTTLFSSADNSNSNSSRNALLVVGAILGGLFLLCGFCAFIGRLRLNSSPQNKITPLKSNALLPTATLVPSPTKKNEKLSKKKSLKTQSSDVDSFNQIQTTRKSSSRGYQLGPRGGCFYINSRGNKTYVDRSYCH